MKKSSWELVYSQKGNGPMTDDEMRALYEEIAVMPKDDRLDLDPIAKALDAYMEKHPPLHPGRFVPNRIVALAAVKMAQGWELAMWNQS
ncbi:MAG: hypothetical protein KGJ13_09390 [Patescibacteria group bacterium]|nr:hypothetical protein [Patescibacteria group bacterium]